MLPKCVSLYPPNHLNGTYGSFWRGDSNKTFLSHHRHHQQSRDHGKYKYIHQFRIGSHSPGMAGPDIGRVDGWRSSSPLDGCSEYGGGVNKI